MTLSAERKGRVTGSQAGAILGLCPWKTREQVLKDWLYGSTFEGNAATEYGKFHEEHAFADLQLMQPDARLSNDEFVIDPHLKWLGCTPDGYIDSEDAVIEIKCPFGLRDEKNPQFKSIHDQPHYYAQVQIEMLCTERSKCYFFQWNRFASQLEIVDLDPDWGKENLPKLYDFLNEVAERRLNLNDDELLATEYKRLKKAHDDAKAALEEHKEKLIKLANGVKRTFGDVSVYPVERKGSVSYSKIVKEHLSDIDTAPYTGKPSTSWVVK